MDALDADGLAAIPRDSAQFVRLVRQQKENRAWRGWIGVWGKAPGEWGAAHTVAAGESPFPDCF